MASPRCGRLLNEINASPNLRIRRHTAENSPKISALASVRKRTLCRSPISAAFQRDAATWFLPNNCGGCASAGGQLHFVLAVFGVSYGLSWGRTMANGKTANDPPNHASFPGIPIQCGAVQLSDSPERNKPSRNSSEFRSRSENKKLLYPVIFPLPWNRA